MVRELKNFGLLHRATAPRALNNDSTFTQIFLQKSDIGSSICLTGLVFLLLLAASEFLLSSDQMCSETQKVDDEVKFSFATKEK